MNRRDFFRAAAVGGAALMLPLGSRAVRADAKTYPGPYYILIHAGGGWDPTMVCDPKGDPVNRGFPKGMYGTAGNHRYAPIEYKDGGGKVLFSNQQFFDKHGANLLVLNGMDTTTGNHDTGTRVTWSGRVSDGFPTFAAVAAAAKMPGDSLGFISSGGYEQTAGLTSLTRVGNVDVIKRVAYPNRINPGDPNANNYVVHSQATIDRIGRMQLERLEDMRAAQGLPRLERAMGSFYDAKLGGNQLTQLTALLPDQAHINSAWNPLHRQALLAIAGFKSGLAVAANLSVGGFDTHGNHDYAQAQALYVLMTGVDLILEELKLQGMDQKVVLVVGSDFGRTPVYNAQAGKDHWNITSMMFVGPGIPGNRVIGGTDDGFKAKTYNPVTLGEDPGGIRIRCDHVQSALRRLAGIDSSAPAKLFPLPSTEAIPLFSA